MHTLHLRLLQNRCAVHTYGRLYTGGSAWCPGWDARRRFDGAHGEPDGCHTTATMFSDTFSGGWGIFLWTWGGGFVEWGHRAREALGQCETEIGRASGRRRDGTARRRFGRGESCMGGNAFGCGARARDQFADMK